MFFDDVDPVNSAESVLMMLNALYASEVIASQQYQKHAVDVRGINATELQGIFLEHAEEEDGHAAKLRDHIAQLGGTLTNKLSTMVRINPHIGGDGDVQSSAVLGELIAQDLAGEKDAIAAYTEAARKLQYAYPGIYLTLCEILRDEMEHAHELANLLGMH